MKQPATIEQKDTAYLISGDVSFVTVMPLRQAGAQVIAQAELDKVRFDFSGVNYCDSSALAVIVVWKRLAQQHNKAIECVHVPDSLLSVAATYGLDELLWTS